MELEQTSPLDARLNKLRGYLAQDPENLGLLDEIVQAALEAGRSDIAWDVLGSVPASLSQQDEVIHLRATAHLAAGRYAEAETELRAMASLATGARFNLAYALARQERHAEAITALRSLLSAGDAPAAALAWLIRSVRVSEGLTPAVAVWESSHPASRNAEAAGVASLLYFDADNFIVAKDLARQALAAGSRPSEALTTEAGVAIVEDRVADAVALMNEALARNPQDGRLWSTLASAFMRDKNLPAAHSAYEKAVHFTPGHIGTWHGFAWCQLMEGDLAAAAASFQSALELDRNFGETHGGLAVIAALEGRRAEAEEAIERALRLDAAGLSARFAQAVLSGEAADRDSLLRLARRLLGARKGPAGGSLADIIFR